MQVVESFLETKVAQIVGAKLIAQEARELLRELVSSKISKYVWLGLVVKKALNILSAGRR